MKQFEKWNKKQHHFVLKRETWRAALKFVMRRGMHHYGNDFLPTIYVKI